jgi:hypothetical protein
MTIISDHDAVAKLTQTLDQIPNIALREQSINSFKLTYLSMTRPTMCLPYAMKDVILQLFANQ